MSIPALQRQCSDNSTMLPSFLCHLADDRDLKMGVVAVEEETYNVAGVMAEEMESSRLGLRSHISACADIS